MKGKYKGNDKLAYFICCLSLEQLMQLHSDLLVSGIAADTGGDPDYIFEVRQKQVSGKYKKLCSALRKASVKERKDMSDGMVENYPALEKAIREAEQRHAAIPNFKLLQRQIC